MSWLFFKEFPGCKSEELFESIKVLEKCYPPFVKKMDALVIPAGYTCEIIGTNLIQTVDQINQRSITSHLEGMPGQCSYCVLYNIGFFANKNTLRDVHLAYIEQFVKDILGYTGMVITTITPDILAYFESKGYKIQFKLRNKRTGNMVFTLLKVFDE